MALENLQLLKKKNRKRLRHLVNSSFSMGINITPPSLCKDSLRIITIILIIGSFGCVYGHICHILQFKNSIIDIADSICTMLQIVISIFKLIYILFVQDRFYKIFKSIETHELIDKIEFLSQETIYNRKLRGEARHILDECWRNAKRQFNFYITACISVISFYFFVPQIVNSYNWYIGNTNHTILFPYRALYPLWETKGNTLPYYFVSNFLDGCGLLASGIGAASFDGMFIFIVLHGVALIRILRHMIVFTTNRNLPTNLRLNYLCQCVDHYERTYQYYREFSELYLHISLVQLSLSLFILGVVMFQASVGLKGDIEIIVKMFFYMAAAGYQVVIYCFNGQMITDESATLPFAFYECEWYNESRDFKQLVKMMITRTNSVFEMPVSWFSNMSLPTLMALLKTSGSYFLLLENLAE